MYEADTNPKPQIQMVSDVQIQMTFFWPWRCTCKIFKTITANTESEFCDMAQTVFVSIMWWQTSCMESLWEMFCRKDVQIHFSFYSKASKNSPCFWFPSKGWVSKISNIKTRSEWKHLSVEAPPSIMPILSVLLLLKVDRPHLRNYLHTDYRHRQIP